MKRLCWLTILVLTCFQPESFGQTQAESIIDRVIETAGGIQAWQDLKNVTYRETETRSEGVISHRTHYFMRNPGQGENFYRIEQEGGGTIERVLPKGQDRVNGKLVVGFDGTEGWLTVDGKLIADPALVDEARFLANAWMYWFSLPFKLKDPGVVLDYQGLQKLEGTPVHVIEVSFGEGVGENSGNGFLYWINADSYRIEKMRYWMDPSRKTNRPYYTYSNYGKIGGITRPLVNLRHAADGPTRRRVWEIVAVNSGLSPSLFRRPQGSSPVQ